MLTRSAIFARRFLNAALSVAPLLAAVVAAVPPGAAGATAQGPYTLEVLVGGRPLPELVGRGRTYVEALAGREYSLRFSNHTGRRVAVAVAVDGLNSIDAQTTTAGEGSKWIVAPYQTLTLEGWQTSSDLARRFFFTTETASYGAWLGKTDNLGLISAVVFRERRERMASPIYQPRAEAERARPRSAARPPAGGASGGEGTIAPAEPQAEAQPGLSDDYAATGIGRELDHRVERISFDAEAAAAAHLEVRYEYRDALVKLGVLPRHPRANPLDRRERARGFSEPGFAPDPYRHVDRPSLQNWK